MLAETGKRKILFPVSFFNKIFGNLLTGFGKTLF